MFYLITSSSRKFVLFLLPIVFSILFHSILMLGMLVFLFLMQTVFDFLLSCAVLVFPINFFNIVLLRHKRKAATIKLPPFFLSCLAVIFILPCSYSIYTPSDKALYIISCSSVSISAVCMGVTSSNILNPLKSPKMPVFRSLFSPLLVLSYHLQ